MYKFEPISLSFENDSTYVVRFKNEDGEVEYKFTVTDDDFLAVGCDLQYAALTNGDPAVPLLAKAIANFHKARHYNYESDS
jgi:hypothetical protein